MPRPTRKIVVTLDTYLSILAVISSFCAIGITFYQAYLQRTEHYASVMPIMDSYLNNGGDDKSWHLTFVFVNNGVGPAIIEKAELTYKGKSFHDMREITNAIVEGKLKKGQAKASDFTGFAMTKSDFWPTRVITAGQVVELCTIDHKYAARWVDEAIGSGEIRIKIGYKSIYGEQWRFDSTPQRIELRNVKVDE
jgi:hypothetical protein